MDDITFTTCQAECTEEIVSAVSAFLSEKLDIAVQAVEDIDWQERIRQVADGRIDVGWVCGSYYSRLVARDNPRVELLVAPVMAQPRYQGQPVYYSDVVVRADSAFETFEDLRGARFAYNEPGSVSGYWTMRYHLSTLGEAGGFFGRISGSGGHVNSLGMILRGEIDTAAIDSTVLDVELEKNPDLAHRIRIVEVLGPTPIPPWVVRRALPEEQKQALRRALAGMPETEEGRMLLAGLHVLGFSAVSDSHYDQVRMMMEKAAVVDW